MSKQIIIDWQRDGLFVAMGSRRGGNVIVETLVPTGWEGGANGSSTAISTQLFALAKKLDLSKAEATIIAPREVLEFRTLTVPRGEADEVPDMVRFQATRQMANIGDTWPLDYILLPDEASQEGITALAATISPAHMAEIEATCSDLGLQLTRVVARPLEIARWGTALGSLAATESAMVIAVSQTHADLLTISQGKLVQVRGTRLPESSTMPTALVAEIRRSVMAASSLIKSQSVSKIVLIAAPDLAERVETPIAQATGASVSVVDPASILPASLPERHELAQKAANRLAAIAGVLCDPNPDKQSVIDLKNCKRREPKKARVKEMSIAAGVAAALAILGIYWWWSSHAQLDLEIANAIKLEKEKSFIVQQTSKAIKQRQDVDGFLAGSINWLDELTHIANNVPPATEVMLTSPSFDTITERTGKTVSTYGQITVTAVGKDDRALGSLREGLRDKEHVVKGLGAKQLPQKAGDYAWTEKATIQVFSNGWDPLATQPKAATTGAAASNAGQSSTAPASAEGSPDTKPGDAKQNDAKPGDAKPSDAKQSDSTPTDSKDQPKPAGPKSAPGPDKPAGPQSAEVPVSNVSSK